MIVQGSSPVVFNSQGGSPGNLVSGATGVPCCCDGSDPPPPGRSEYFLCRACNGALKIWTNIANWVFSHDDDQCYDCAHPVQRLFYTPAELAASGWDTLFGHSLNIVVYPDPIVPCDEICVCNHDCEPTPPEDPPPTPTPECACDAFATTADFCACIPDTIRATVSGMVACVCIPCGNWSFISFRLDELANGVYDLLWDGLEDNPAWSIDVTLDFSYNVAGESPLCTLTTSTAFTLTLAKINATTFAFAIKFGAYEDDPRAWSQVDDDFRLFIGSGEVPTRTCFSVPTMVNESSCQCDESTPAPFGFFYAHIGGAHSGSVSFSTCIP